MSMTGASTTLVPCTPLATIDLIIVLSFLLLVTVIGYVMSNVASKGLKDYFLGGRSIPWYVLGISTATSNFDMSGTMVIVSIVFALGYRGLLVELRGGAGITLAFLMVFLAKWLRRSRVMTSAEWMKIRFGNDRQGKLAHLLSAVANTLLSLGMIIYFAKGAGKFLTHFLPVSEFWCMAIMVGVGLFYTLMSGLYGVVFTDVIQMILLNITAIYITFKAFSLVPTVRSSFPAGFFGLDLSVPDTLGKPLLKSNPGEWEAIFSFFGVCVFFWLMRSTLEGCGGVGGYTDQRFFAARSEREAALLTMESIILSVFRWTMIAGLVVMGYHLLGEGGVFAKAIAQDSENVLPIVLGHLMPVGIRGIVIAGLIAAAMSTFDSTLNAGASYIVKDIYATYVNPKADHDRLMWASKVATAGLCVVGVGLALLIENINEIWGFITMGLGAGMYVPLFLRWFWPRFNGYGFAAGTAAGLVTAVAAKGFFTLPLYHFFPLVVGVSLLFSVVAALATPPVSDDLLVDFWVQINPWGLWGEYIEKAKEKGLVDETSRLRRLVESLNDMVSLCFALPFQLACLLAAMSFVFHDWYKFAVFSSVALLCGTGLYFFWYRNLKDEETCRKEDELYDEKVRVLVGTAD